MSERTERQIPLAVAVTAILAFAIVCFFDKIPKFQADPRGFLSMVNDVGAIFVGFIVATVTYLLSISNSPGMRFVKQAGKFKLLIWYFVHAGATWFCLCMLDLVFAGGLTAEYWITGKARLALLGVWFILATYAIGSLCRILVILKSLSILLAEND